MQAVPGTAETVTGRKLRHDSGPPAGLSLESRELSPESMHWDVGTAPIISLCCVSLLVKCLASYPNLIPEATGQGQSTAAKKGDICVVSALQPL